LPGNIGEETLIPAQYWIHGIDAMQKHPIFFYSRRYGQSLNKIKGLFIFLTLNLVNLSGNAGDYG